LRCSDPRPGRGREGQRRRQHRGRHPRRAAGLVEGHREHVPARAQVGGLRGVQAGHEQRAGQRQGLEHLGLGPLEIPQQGFATQVVVLRQALERHLELRPSPVLAALGELLEELPLCVAEDGVDDR
jgi:hypothetical protein